LFKHDKQLLHPVKVDKPNPTYAAMLQEQLGGAEGELTAGLRYISESFRVADPAIKDLFLDIGAEEFSHMEMVATTVNLLLGQDPDATKVVAGNIQPHLHTGMIPALVNASGFPWTAAYLDTTGDLVCDLITNIAAEQRAKVVYEYLWRQINDKGVRETIDFLLNREEAHNALFREALARVQDTGSNRDYGTTQHSRLYFDLSTPGRHFADPRPTAPAFENPRQQPPSPPQQ